MSGLTSKLGMYLPGGGSTGNYDPDEVLDVDKLNSNFQKLDDAAGMHTATSTSMPSTPYKNMLVFVSDIDTLKTWDGSQWIVVASNYDSGVLTDAVKKADDWELVQSELQLRGASGAYIYVRVKYTGSKTISIPTSGNIVNQPVAEIKSEDNYAAMDSALSSSHTGAVAAAYVNTTGVVRLSAVAYESGGIKSGKEYTLAGYYNRKGSV